MKKKELQNVDEDNKTRSVQELNQRLIKLNEQQSRLAKVGQNIVGDYNYKQISDKIPTKALGKIGQVFYEKEIKEKLNFEQDLEVVNKALKNIKRKINHAELSKQGIVVNQKQYKDDPFILEQPLGELFDLPNPHYKKVFNPDKFYQINQSDDEDAFDKMQREELETKGQFQEQKKLKKNQILSRINQKIKDRQLDEYDEYLNYQNNSFDQGPGRQSKSLKSIIKKDYSKLPKNVVIVSGKNEASNINVIDNSQSEAQIKKIPRWKQASEAVRAALRNNNEQELNENLIDALHANGLVKCEHCGRKFNQNAAEKHIPLCQDKKLNEKMKTQRKRKQSLQK